MESLVLCFLEPGYDMDSLETAVVEGTLRGGGDGCVTVLSTARMAVACTEGRGWGQAHHRLS
jgi:hypothetical protein